jgi:integrase
MSALTDIQIKQWIKAKAPVAKADGGGLTFTLSASGRASWVLRYRIAGKGKEKTLGQYPDTSLAEARRLASEDRAKVQQGVDVAAVKQRAKREAANSWTVRQLGDDYLKKAEGRLEVSTLDGQRQRLRVYVYPVIGSVAAQDIRPSDLVSIAERASKKSLHVARLVLGVQKAIFAHGLCRHVVESDPASQIKTSALLGPRPVARTRVMLTEEELKAVLPILPKMGVQNALMAKILLGTAVRLGELVGARWENVDFVTKTWLIPPCDIKGKKGKARNGEDVRGFIIPLSDPVIQWFSDLKDLAFGSGFVLPIRSRKKAVGDAHMEAVTLNAAFNKFWKINLSERCQRFTPHDLRSTARSHLGRLGVDLLIAERCLNHSLGGLVAIYDQHDYLIERRAALMQLSEFLVRCEREGEDSKN